MQNFPSFMSYVKSVKIIKKIPDGFISAWNVFIDGVPVSWQEQDIFDNKNLSINFQMLNGDYLKYQGSWRLLDDLYGCKIILSLDLDVGASAFTRFPEVEKVLNRKIRKAFKGMLLAIKIKLIGKK